jgi:peptidoglycan/xylan/chitin deacetylase (PgdA/CDA1 family)
MKRRDFMLALAAGTVAVTGCSDAHLPKPAPTTTVRERPLSNGLTTTAKSLPAHPHPHLASPTAHPPKTIAELPGNSNRIALTIDDGVSSHVVGTLIDFVRASRVRITFFPNGIYSSWTDHAAKLRPLVESGQVQLGNHTWSHPDLTKLSDRDVEGQIRRNDQFLRTTFGVHAGPFLRPPYGFHDKRTDRIAADLGYHLITMWYGSLGDGTSGFTADQLVANGQRWLGAGRIVIGHANKDPITHVYGQLLDIIRSRHLQTVTLADVFGH